MDVVSTVALRRRQAGDPVCRPILARADVGPEAGSAWVVSPQEPRAHRVGVGKGEEEGVSLGVGLDAAYELTPGFASRGDGARRAHRRGHPAPSK